MLSVLPHVMQDTYCPCWAQVAKVNIRSGQEFVLIHKGNHRILEFEENILIYCCQSEHLTCQLTEKFFPDICLEIILTCIVS